MYQKSFFFFSFYPLFLSFKDSRSVLSLGSASRVHGIDFAYQGVLGIWEGLATTVPELTGQLVSLDLAGISGSPPMGQSELSPGLDLSSNSRVSILLESK